MNSDYGRLQLVNTVQQWCNTHDKITLDPKPFEQWFSALHGSGSKEEKLINLGIDEERAKKAVGFVQGASNDLATCLIVSVLLLVNNHLPPAESQSPMKREFEQGHLKDLYHSLKRGANVYGKALVGKIDQFS